MKPVLAVAAAFIGLLSVGSAGADDPQTKVSDREKIVEARVECILNGTPWSECDEGRFPFESKRLADLPLPYWTPRTYLQ